MKNYAEKDKMSSFILYFDIIDENDQKWIVIHYADGTEERKVYSIKEEKIQLDKMRKQVINSKDLFEDLEKQYSKDILAIIGIGLINMAAISILIMSIIQALSIYAPICLIVPLSISMIILAAGASKDKKTLDDIEKNMMIIQNMDSLNQARVSEKRLSRVSSKAKKVIGDRETIDLNVAHHLSLNDTIKLLDEEPGQSKVYSKRKK